MSLKTESPLFSTVNGLGRILRNTMSYTLQVGVKVLLKNEDGNFLLLKRSTEKYKFVKDGWDIPGGRINPEMDLISNLKREVSEETKMSLEEGTLKILGAQDIFHGEDKHVVRITFEGKASGNIVLSEEHTEFKWVTIKEALKIEGLDRYLREVLEKKN